MLVLDRPSPKASAHAYCDVHDPDPTEYGNKTTWAEKITLRRYDEPVRDFQIYGRPGGQNYRGITMHVETPGGDGVLCGREDASETRYELTRAMPDGYQICRNCIEMSGWTDDYSRAVVAAFLYRLRDLLDDLGELPDSARMWLEYHDDKSSHKLESTDLEDSPDVDGLLKLPSWLGRGD